MYVPEAVTYFLQVISPDGMKPRDTSEKTGYR